MGEHDLDLTIHLSRDGFALQCSETVAGEGITAVFGPSGGGKSTLLRAIAGLVTPDRGRIASGADVWFDTAAGVNRPAHERPAGLMFQDLRLFPHLTVEGNLRYADRRAPAGKEGRPDYAMADVIAALDLAPLLGRRVQGLSGGEGQRVALGRTLLTRPRLLLLDEPLSALDRDRKAAILPLIADLPRRFSIPVLYVSHALDEVAQLADRILVLDQGRVAAHGPAGAVMERLDLEPVTGAFEAGVLLEARITGHDRDLCLITLDLAGHPLVMPEPVIPPASPVASVEQTGDRKQVEGRMVRLRIRSRDVALATARPEGLSIRNILPARIRDVTPDPASAYAHVLLDVEGHHLHARVTRASARDLALAPGMAVFALIKSVTLDQRLD